MTSPVVSVKDSSRNTATSLELAELLLESLDTGVMLIDGEGRILRGNSVSHELCAAFGTTVGSVPPPLWIDLRRQCAAAEQARGRFTIAVRIMAPDGRRLYFRCCQVPGAMFAVTISLAALREGDVKRVLAIDFGLNAQEIRIAFLAAQGARNREIADRLAIVEGTVKNYLTNVFAALAVRSRTELATKLARLVEK